MWLNPLKNMVSRKEAIRFYKSKSQIILNLLNLRSDHQINLNKPNAHTLSNEEPDTLFSGKEKMDRIFGKSLKIRQVDAGSCNACEWECTALTNSIYDIQRFGIDLSPLPDTLMCYL